jgi:hypothetical protein
VAELAHMQRNCCLSTVESIVVALRTCKFEGCERARQTRGLCATHLKLDPDAPRCTYPGCDRPKLTGKYCGTHTSQVRRKGVAGELRVVVKNQPCPGPMCTRMATCLDGYCRPHHEQLVKHGELWVIGSRKGSWHRPPITVCVEADCTGSVLVWGRCAEHASQALGTCWLPGCALPASHKQSGLCDLHRRRAHRMQSEYGIGWVERMRMAEEQDHRCLICGKLDDLLNDPLHIDHDHETGQVRGLLCGPCNRGIGALRHSPDLLRRAMTYLERTGG